MENSDMESVFQMYFESYRQHNLETKAIRELSCVDGVQWLWITFGECLLSMAQTAGYLCGAISMLFWTVGYLMVCSQIQPVNRLWSHLTLTFIVNVVSFAGAIMSFQMIFVIWYDMFTTLILVLVKLAALLTLLKLLPPCHKYQPPGKDQSQSMPTPTQRNTPGAASSRVCCTLLYLVTMSMFLVIFIALASATDVYPQHILLSTMGYLLGCLACFGRWWIEILFVSINNKEMGENRIWTGGGVLLIASNMMYLVGVLLQSGSFRVAIVTLPWLAGSYESDSSDIIFNRSLQAPAIRAGPGQADNEGTLTLHRSITSQVTSLGEADTSDSESTNITSEQELRWADHVAVTASNDFTENLLGHQRFSLASQIETMSQSSSETSDQRVRSWISQSTPEEETPPCLTLTLNLDTGNKSTNNLTDDKFFQNKKCNFAAAFPLSIRKNSF